MYLDRLHIQNFRCLSQGELSFNVPGRAEMVGLAETNTSNVNLFIGGNGTGKTTTFQALAIAPLKPLFATSVAGFSITTPIRYGYNTADSSVMVYRSALDTSKNPNESKLDDLLLHISGGRATATFKRRGDSEYLEGRGNPPGWSDSLFVTHHPGFFLAAYGASRRTMRPEAYDERKSNIRYQRVASLFDINAGLMPLSLAWNICQENNRWQEVVEIVNRLLHPPVRITEEIRNTEPIFDFEGVRLEANSLSDGYRLYVAWLIDFLGHLSRVLPRQFSLTEAVGSVFVDEVDLFLSPAWQRTVVEGLATTFPRIQWFFSTHSPLVASGLNSENIFIVEHSAPFTSHYRRPTSKFEGKSLDEVLIELFDIPQPRSTQLERQLNNLADRAIEGDIDASIEYLRYLRLGTAASTSLRKQNR